jgi:hypothetical protein
MAMLGEGGQLLAVGAHLLVVEARPAGERHVALVLHRAGRFAIDQNAGAVLAEQLQLRVGAVLFAGKLVLQHETRIPARNEF